MYTCINIGSQRVGIRDPEAGSRAVDVPERHPGAGRVGLHSVKEVVGDLAAVQNIKQG